MAWSYQVAYKGVVMRRTRQYQEVYLAVKERAEQTSSEVLQVALDEVDKERNFHPLPLKILGLIDRLFSVPLPAGEQAMRDVLRERASKTAQ